MVRPTRLLILLVVSAAACTGALAQSRTASGLTGRVQDEGGAALPGVTIEIASPALIGGVRAVTTDEHGRYRFSEIHPGAYRLSARIAGYREVAREAIVLSLGLTTDVSFTMTQVVGTETVQVTVGSNAIDPTSSAVTTVLSNEYLQALPTVRDEFDILNLAPGINMGSAFGGAEETANAYQIDGVDVSDPQDGTPWAFFNYNLVQQVTLVGLGAPAEYGGFTGTVFNTITKSGSNSFSGLADFLYSDKSLSALNTASKDLQTGLKKSFDTTFQVGGPFLKDKLWYFVSGQYFADDRAFGGPPERQRDPRLFGKLSWQPSSQSTVEAWVEHDRYDISGRNGDPITPLAATVTQRSAETVWNFSWKTTPTAEQVISIAYTGYDGFNNFDPRNGYHIAGRFNPDIGPNGSYTTNSTYFFKSSRTRHQLNASLSQHASDFIKGSHDFKFGMEIERSTVRNRYGYTTGAWFYDNYVPASGPVDDPGTPANDPTPFTLGYYGSGYDVHAKSERLSAYAQDSWQITPNFTINPGVRLDMNRGSVGRGLQVFSTNPVAPRIGFAWNLLGDGRSILKAHYGRYYDKLLASSYYWVDPGAFEAGQTRAIFPSGANVLIKDYPPQRYDIGSNLRQPSMDEYILGLDSELAEGLTLNLAIIYRRNKNFLETVSEYGQFVPVRGHPPASNRMVTLYDYLNPDTDVLIVTNPPGLHRSYRGEMLTLTKRLGKNWMLIGSYVWSRSEGNIDNSNVDGQTVGLGPLGGNSPGDFLNTPNSIANYQGRLTHDQTHQVKLQGSYVFPKIGLSLSGNYTFHSGDTWTRRSDCLLTDDNGDGTEQCHVFPQGPFRYFAEPRGSRRLPSRSEFDLRAEWFHNFPAGRLGLMADVFNAFNQVRATAVEDRDGLGLGNATKLNLPRTVRVGARFSW
jgi:outer membrane receptor protein involved in Fe transport